MDGNPIKQVGHIKLVGFTIDSKLTWGLMIGDIAEKARKRIAALNRMSTKSDENLSSCTLPFSDLFLNMVVFNGWELHQVS